MLRTKSIRLFIFPGGTGGNGGAGGKQGGGGGAGGGPTINLGASQSVVNNLYVDSALSLHPIVLLTTQVISTSSRNNK